MPSPKFPIYDIFQHNAYFTFVWCHIQHFASSLLREEAKMLCEDAKNEDAKVVASCTRGHGRARGYGRARGHDLLAYFGMT